MAGGQSERSEHLRKRLPARTPARQANFAINQSNGKGASFANNGLAGQSPLPIFGAVFGTAASNYTNSAFITNLQTGAAGALANSLAGNTTFFCNMVGATAFPACATKGNFAATGQYPINFWQVNPFASGRNVNYLDSAGMSNYHGLQVEFRQRPTHGAQFNVNYTWSHSLGISAQNGIQGQGNNIYYTLRQRNLRSAVRQGTTIPQLWLGRQRRVRRLGRWARFW